MQAREEGYAVAIANITDLAEAEVRRRLERGVGKRRVWRVFEEEWPARDNDEVLAARGGMTAAAAREENYAAEIAKITGLTEETVRARVAGAHPGKRMRSVFSVEWPPGIAARGRMTIEDASMFVALEDAVASITGLTWDVVGDRLSQADANTLVHDVFRTEWPEKYLAVAEGVHEETDDEAWYGRLRCSVVRGANRVARIAKDLRLSEAEVRTRLDAVPGRTLVRKVFAAEWPKKAEERSGTLNKKAPKGVPSAAADGAHWRSEDSKLAPLGQAPAREDGGNLERASLGQGSDVHRILQHRIASLGMVRGDHAETDKPLAAGFRPDVAWFRREAGSDKPYHVFEIERGAHGAKAKSLQSLQLAYERFNADITLLVHEAHIEAVRRMVPGRIAGRLNLLTIEACLDCGHDSLRLAKVLKLDVGERR